VKYKNKITKKVISEMARRRGKKIGKSGERLGSLDNTIAQQSGHGTLRRSSEIAKGKVANLGDRLEKLTDIKNINSKAAKKRIRALVKIGKITPEAAQAMLDKIDKNTLAEASTAEFFKDGGELKVIYNNDTMSIKEFLKKAKIDNDMNSILAKLKDEMKEDDFSGTLIQYIANKFGKDATPNDVMKYSNGKSVINKEVE